MKAPAKSSGSSSPAVSIPGTAREPRGLFALLAEHGHEQVSAYYEPSCGYRGIITIHSTVLGPALGGTRFWNYRTDEEALIDCLRLARGMTYKAAVAGLDLGGGKSVIIGDHRTTRREALFRAHGRHIESLKGRYITAEDVGTSTSDMEYIKAETNHVTGLIGKSGDPSPVTAYGVYRGMKACARYRYGSDGLQGKTIALQGCGSVGYHLAGLLHAEGADDRHGDLLEERRITYAPDYVINSGGLINVHAELNGWSPERARSKAGEIYDTILRVFEIARDEGIPSYRAADRLAERRIAAIGNVRRNFV